MTGAKQQGDARLRTPMHWSRNAAAGFTRGTPWEPLPADSFTANVEAQDGDPASLLNHHRRLIQLRTSQPALGATGAFIPLTASAPGAIAYVRRSDRHVALVVANLGAQTLSNVGLTAARTALPAGRYTAKTIFGGDQTMTLRVTGNGRIQNWTMPELGPFESRVLQLTRTN